MLKIREVFSFSEDFPLNSEVYVDEFVLGGKDGLPSNFVTNFLRPLC